MEHANGMSQSDLARALATRLRVGFDRSKVYKILKEERDVSAEEMLAIEEITGFPAPASLRGMPKAGMPKDTPKITRVPLLDSVAAGKLKAPSSQIPVEDVPLLAFADLGRGEFFALNVEGDSMDRISPEGSIIIVNKADRTLINGRCYVFSHRGETTYKMWQSGDPAHLAPYSTNPVNKPIFFKNKKDLEVIGRVKRTLLDL
ncbi:helix-turn-helix transcriptional regulator [Bradyrhizobium sp. BRP22]|uniref:XRE family transcriptional regulator n=1 Tax=Bradyrhizobium sp. BRP22 TaxID=2793821 RepID=UPI001CD329A6|nr:XRE family transcriptional regulator [Bradyrhizobium sp. BRP22]MCA1458045.1 helix-turn-helix transcriptional regulator [Bradyrhizobium sp. BRP22]